MGDAGYDVQDFCQVDPRYGSNEEARELFAAIHKRNMRVIIDFVPGHTSIDHPWFQESAKSHPALPFRNWYIWTQSAWDDGGSPWNQKMIHGYSNRNGNFLINFFWNQPALNFGFARPEANQPWQLPTTHKDVQLLWKEMRSILRFWLEMGVDGFRVDMADSLIRNDPGKKEIRRFWSEARAELEQDFPELFLIAEGHPSNLLDGRGFHSAFLHWAPGYWSLFRPGETRSQAGEVSIGDPFFNRSGKGDFRPYLQTWRKEYEQTAEKGIITVPVGNHDLPRIAIGQSTDDIEMVFAFQTAWPGIPFIYYGDEIGMHQQSSDNPIHEGHYPTRNGARTPMQWSQTENCGFSDAPAHQLYLPVDPAPGQATVEDQEADSRSLLHRVRKLNHLRRSTPALAPTTPVELILEGAPGTPLAFLRGDKGDRLLCFFHPAGKASRHELPDSILPLDAPLAASTTPPCRDGASISAPGPSWAIWKVDC